MYPSVRTLVLTLATLAIGGAQGLKLQRRDDPVDDSDSQGPQNILLTNAEQTLFYTPMGFGSGNGVLSTFAVVSTTRSDIILPGGLAKNLTGFVSQGKSVAEGPIYAGPISVAGWTVPDQDLIYYENPGADLPIKVDGEYAYGGFGIWPNTSTIAQAFGDWSADSIIARITAEPETGLYWTLLLNPSEYDRGTDHSLGGVLTIGEIVDVTQIFNVTQEDLQKVNFPDLKSVVEYPYLNSSYTYDGTAYYAVIDAISWGSRSVTLKSTIPDTPQGKIAAYLDSTYSWIEVPYSVTEEMYKGLEGATYDKDRRLWHFKCTELTITITIAGHDYPLSPLTAVQHVDGLNCVGTFQAKSEGAGGDVVLGVPFLKNVYARFAYQSRKDGEVYDPYAQIMSIINIEESHKEWEVWYKKWSGSPYDPSSSLPYPSSSYSVSPTPTVSYSSSYSPSLSVSYSPSVSVSYSPSVTPSPSPSPTGRIAGAVENDDNDNEEDSDPAKRNLPVIIAASVLGGLALIGGIVFVVIRMRNGRDGKGTYRGVADPDDGSAAVKVPLYDAESSSGNYGDGGQGRYTDPYKD